VERMNEKQKKKQVIKISVFITSIFVIFLSVAYAFINLTLQGTKKQVITAGNLELDLIEDENNITLTDALPIYDEVGMIQDAFTFRLKNKGTTDVNYTLKLVDITTGDKLETSDVKYYLTKDGTGTPALLSTLTDGQVDSGTIAGNQTIEYTLRLWIDASVTENSRISGKSLSYRIDVETSQNIECVEIAETSPNVPELTSGMIPVVYDEAGKTWKKADTSSEWYNYSNQNWANAVTVVENGTKTREYYQSAEAGEPININDINTMWVWIPRYSYTIMQPYGRGTQKCSDLGEISASSPTVCRKLDYPQSLREEVLNVCQSEFSSGPTESECMTTIQGMGAPYETFEQFIDFAISEGLVTDTRTLVETYPDNIATGLTQPGAIDIKFITEEKKDSGTGKCTKCTTNWVTPEGFSFGDEELPGFWMAKFETSTLETCTAENGSVETDCDLTTFTPQVKPNVTSWRGARVSIFFQASRLMQDSSNANKYGFDTIGTGTMDVHMLKNTEWGIVAMLSQSKYGKYGNPNYEGVNKEVYQNKSSEYITGMSNGTPSQSETNTQVTYDTPNTGYGASTTGTIYGVYDMSGGAWEYVMGNYNKVSGSSASDNSGFEGTNGPTSGGLPWPDSKYYDLYISTTASTGYKTGDATYETREWYSDDTFFVGSSYPWFLRGGYYGHHTYAGVFGMLDNGGISYSSYGFRLAIKP